VGGVVSCPDDSRRVTLLGGYPDGAGRATLLVDYPDVAGRVTPAPWLPGRRWQGNACTEVTRTSPAG
jgi:hypothetical protein